jgi:CBS domain-containing protein
MWNFDAGTADVVPIVNLQLVSEKTKIMKQCQDIMLDNPSICLSKDTVYNVARRMHTENIDVLLVVESYQGKKLVGLITDRDIALRVVGRGLIPVNTPISDIMTHNLIVCSPFDDLDATLKNMLDHEIRRVPVVDEDNGLIGIIVQARIVQVHLAIRLERDNNISGFQIKETTHGWGNFTDVLDDALNRIGVLKHLQESLNPQNDDLNLFVRQGSG